MRTKKILISLLTALAATTTWANVSIKNGNFFIGYTDIIYPGGFEPKIERVYNSKSPFKGMFGWGWGNEYEVRLKVSADGSVVVHEYGGGAENRFNPRAFNSKELDAAVAMISEAARQAGQLGTPGAIDQYRKKLRTDATFRNEEWENFRNSGKLQERQLPVGTQLQSNRFSYQYVTRTKEGYIRTFDTGRNEYFSLQGRLIRVTDRNGNSITLTYGKEGNLQKLVDNFNRKMFFTFNSKGLVEKIEGENGKVATYRYNDQDELVVSKDVDGNSFAFKYSGDKRHNMIEIGYGDKTTQQIAYYGRDQHENVKSVRDRDKGLTEYSYDTDPKDKDHYAVAVKVKDGDGKTLSSNRYEYFIKRKADGEEWTQKLVTTLDGERTETVYNECCGLPISIKKPDGETTFAYDAKGHVTKKVTPNEITELGYDMKAGKVSKVVRYSRSEPNRKEWSTFQYDAKGNLVAAKNSEGKGVTLFYDRNGRISTMKDHQKRTIKFKYNENSKPIEITDPAVGSISVTYANSGEIKSVDSKGGRRIASQVTSAFQNLLDIIRPAGVNLSF